MELPLNPIEVRILGALVEKQITTPEYYPLSLNALVNACNQKSNREPVMNLGEENVEATLDRLRGKQLVRMIIEDTGRVPKYAHALTQALKLTRPQVAALCVLMLRGPQTTGEIRGRSGRLHDFQGLTEVEQALAELAEREGGALVVRLPRQAGFKEVRYAHLLAGPPPPEAPRAMPETARAGALSDDGRWDKLEEEIRQLRQELQGLSAQFAAFKKQFE